MEWNSSDVMRLLYSDRSCRAVCFPTVRHRHGAARLQIVYARHQSCGNFNQARSVFSTPDQSIGSVG